MHQERMVIVPFEEWKQLESNSIMLGQIGMIAQRYCRTPETTTLECVKAMDARVKKLNARIRKIKSI